MASVRMLAHPPRSGGGTGRLQPAAARFRGGSRRRRHADTATAIPFEADDAPHAGRLTPTPSSSAAAPRGILAADRESNNAVGRFSLPSLALGRSCAPACARTVSLHVLRRETARVSAMRSRLTPACSGCRATRCTPRGATLALRLAPLGAAPSARVGFAAPSAHSLRAVARRARSRRSLRGSAVAAFAPVARGATRHAPALRPPPRPLRSRGWGATASATATATARTPRTSGQVHAESSKVTRL
jgi:hypothetical protein